MLDIILGIVGGGTVGKAIARTYLEHVHEVRIFDTVKERATHTFEETAAADLIFCCLPTPFDAESPGALDVSTIEGFISAIVGLWIEAKPGTRKQSAIVIRSTVPIGTTLRLNRQREHFDDFPWLLHSPEFLTARCALSDAMIPTRNVIGLPGGHDNPGRLELEKLYRCRFPGTQLFICSSDESEALKLIQNSFFAAKVSFFNEARTLCDKMDLDWELIRRMLLADGRIAEQHTKVPGPDGRFGFGGECLQKDLQAFIRAFANAELPASVSIAAHSRNRLDRYGDVGK